MNLFKRICACNHNWEITERSNVIQLDDMGYPLRLVIWKCSKCGKSDQVWLDVAEEQLEELNTGKSVLLQWEKVNKKIMERKMEENKNFREQLKTKSYDELIDLCDELQTKNVSLYSVNEYSNHLIDRLYTENKNLKEEKDRSNKIFSERIDKQYNEIKKLETENKNLTEENENKQVTIDMLLYSASAVVTTKQTIPSIEYNNPNTYNNIAFHMRKKYEALIKAGFTEDQAMSFLPMWTDDEE